MQLELEVLKQKTTDIEELSSQCRKLEDELTLKNEEIKNISNELAGLQKDFENAKKISESQIQEKTAEISKLSDILNDLNQYKADSDTEKNNLKLELNEARSNIILLQNKFEEKSAAEGRYKQQIDDLNIHKDEDSVKLHSKISELNSEIEEVRSKLNDSLAIIDSQKTEFENKFKEKETEITILNDKLKNVTECKDEIIGNLKSMVTEKDEQVIALNIEVTKLSENLLRTEDELKETQAELEIGRDEYISLKEEHDDLVIRIDDNVILKNQETRELHSEITKLKQDLTLERERLGNEYESEKQVGRLVILS